MSSTAYLTRRADALQQLAQFSNTQLAAYAQQRNHDTGPEKTFVSQLSAAISRRLISEEEVIQKVLSQHSWQTCEKYVQEVCWRSYWKAYLQNHPQIWQGFLQDLGRLEAQWANQASYLETLHGQVDIPCFKHWLEELRETGYLHNHARMWFASIWIYTLKLPWQLGAAFFMRNLLDFDPASNTLSWRWVAGLHTKGKQYLATAQNISKYSQFDPDPDSLAQETFPIEESISSETENPNLDLTQNQATQDFQSLGKAKLKTGALLLHSENCFLSDLSEQLKPSTIFIYAPDFSKHSARVRAYQSELLGELRHLASQRFPLVSLQTCTELTQISDTGFTELYVLAPHVGEVHDQLRGFQKESNVSFKPISHSWDLAIQDFPTRGFFPFWKEAKKMLKRSFL